jgi:hypothetical protein
MRKGRASRNKCYALSATEGYISGWLKPTLSIRAFGACEYVHKKAGV